MDVDKACRFIAGFEGLSLTPYQHPGDKPTIGFGSTYYEDWRPVQMKDPAITEDRAWELLRHFVKKAVDVVDQAVTALLTENQRTALTSFQYNTGMLTRSTLLVRLNEGDYDAAARQFSLWVHSGSVVLPGLVRRRQAEAELFLTPDDPKPENYEEEKISQP